MLPSHYSLLHPQGHIRGVNIVVCKDTAKASSPIHTNRPPLPLLAEILAAIHNLHEAPGVFVLLLEVLEGQDG